MWGWHLAVPLETQTVDYSGMRMAGNLAVQRARRMGLHWVHSRAGWSAVLMDGGSGVL